MKRTNLFLLCVLLAFEISVGQVPKTLSFQGYLTDAADEPADGNFEMTFSIFETETGGVAIWTEIRTSVPVDEGLYSVILGDINGLNLAFDKTYFLQVKVGTETLTPRLRLASSAYSISGTNASNIETGTVSGSLVGNDLDGQNLSDATITSNKISPLAVTNTLIADGAVDNVKIGESSISTTKIVDNAITTGKIAGEAIDNSRLADNAVGTTKILNAAITAEKMSDLSVTAGKLADGAVTADKIANSSVTNLKIADGAITSTKLQGDLVTDANRAVNTEHIRDGAINSSKLADNSVTSGKLQSDASIDANRAITSNHIRDFSVTQAKLADGSVSSAKLQSDAAVDANRAVTTDHIRDNAVTIPKIGTAGLSDANKILVTDANGDPQLVASMATLAVDGYTRLGANSPNIQLKKIITGQTGMSEGFDVGISHGLSSSSKILSVEAVIETSSGVFYPPGYRISAEFEYGWYITATQVRIAGAVTNSGSLVPNKAIKIIITYEE